MLTADMKSFIEVHRLGLVATVNDDGTPNLSPKGTMVVINDDRIVFADIRSPNTARNIKARPSIEINFVDVFARKAVRVRGAATYISRSDEAFEKLAGVFLAWPDLMPKFRGIFDVQLLAAKLETSPAYDTGATEDELKRHYREHFSLKVQ